MNAINLESALKWIAFTLMFIIILKNLVKK
jgi:hypothetical protein